jgi:hypothetical protein
VADSPVWRRASCTYWMALLESIANRRLLHNRSRLQRFPVLLRIGGDPVAPSILDLLRLSGSHPTPANAGYRVARHYRLTSITIEPMRALLA